MNKYRTNAKVIYVCGLSDDWKISCICIFTHTKHYDIIYQVKLRQKLIRNYSGKDDRDSFVLTSMEYFLLYIVFHRTVYLIALLDTRSF